MDRAALVVAAFVAAWAALPSAGAWAQQAPAPSTVRPAEQHKPAAKPGPRSGAKPANKPAAKPANKPASRPAAKPAVPSPAPAPVPTPEPEKPVEPGKGSNTGLPIPRFASLRSDDVNMRSGPGTRYPIEWQYKRRDLPVQIEREFEIWRLVRDQEGVKGWVHQATLAPRRTGVVLDGEKLLRRDPKDDATPVARLKPGVIVRLRSCEQGADWCQAQVQDYRGWIKRGDVWGTFPGEAIQ